MQNRIRSLVAVAAALFVLSTAYVFTTAQNKVPKYDAGGALVDSAISEVSGNVGIGTGSPLGKLHVETTSGWQRIVLLAPDGSDINLGRTTDGVDRAIIGWTGSTTTGYGYFTTAGGERPIALQYAGGNVGIGTVSPLGKLHVESTSGWQRIQLLAPDGSDINLGRTTTGVDRALIGWTGSTTTGYGFFQTSGGERPIALQYAGGNVGIGTTTPSAKLHVAGNVIVDGNIGAKYQDVAEWVDASMPAESGAVVVADSERVNHVRPSTQPYDTAVAGVVSRQPGVLLGEAGTGKVMVAQSGRVRVKVDAELGAIKPGDLLVASAIPGHAMKSQPVSIGGIEMHRPGTIIGKALEPLNEGRGEVLVLLTLQ